MWFLEFCWKIYLSLRCFQVKYVFIFFMLKYVGNVTCNFGISLSEIRKSTTWLLFSMKTYIGCLLTLAQQHPVIQDLRICDLFTSNKAVHLPTPIIVIRTRGKSKGRSSRCEGLFLGTTPKGLVILRYFIEPNLPKNMRIFVIYNTDPRHQTFCQDQIAPKKKKKKYSFQSRTAYW